MSDKGENDAVPHLDPDNETDKGFVEGNTSHTISALPDEQTIFPLAGKKNPVQLRRQSTSMAAKHVFGLVRTSPLQ